MTTIHGILAIHVGAIFFEVNNIKRMTSMWCCNALLLYYKGCIDTQGAKRMRYRAFWHGFVGVIYLNILNYSKGESIL